MATAPSFPADHIPPSDATLQAIGHVAYQWSYLEELIAGGIWWLLDLRVSRPKDLDRARAITTHLNVPTRLNMLRSLARTYLTEAADIAELDKHADRIRQKLAGKRNGVVHGLWTQSTKPNRAWQVTFSARGEVVPTFRELTDTQIHDIAREIDNCANELLEFFRRTGIGPRA